jgi:hypothetical protein
MAAAASDAHQTGMDRAVYTTRARDIIKDDLEHMPSNIFDLLDICIEAGYTFPIQSTVVDKLALSKLVGESVYAACLEGANR